jgi:arylsulfatase A-like enzyme
LLTGEYPFRLGNPAWGTFPADAELRTIAQVVKSAGYATAVVGKWQLSLLKDDFGQPGRLGFDEYCLLGWHEVPWYYQPHIWQNGQRRTDVSDRYGPDVIFEYLSDFIARHKRRPFFAFYSMTLCHSETNDLERHGSSFAARRGL